MLYVVVSFVFANKQPNIPLPINWFHCRIRFTNYNPQKMKKQNTYYSEPFKEGSVWCINRFDKTLSEGAVEVIPFKSKQKANEFLQTVNVYVDGKLCYSSI